MTNKEIELLAENEREWRQYMITKIDRIDKEMSTLKIKVFGIASLFGGSAGFGADFFKNLMTGG